MSARENSILQSLVRKAQHSFFFEHLIRKKSNRLIRGTWLKWLGKCMHANKVKTQEWLGYMQVSMHSNNTEHLGKFASDGFLLNLLDLLLEYSMPFCATPYCNKLLKINDKFLARLFGHIFWRQLRNSERAKTNWGHSSYKKAHRQVEPQHSGENPRIFFHQCGRVSHFLHWFKDSDIVDLFVSNNILPKRIFSFN